MSWSNRLVACLIFLLSALCLPSSVYAIVDPLAVPNNRFGIHLIQPTPNEASPAADLVNSSGGDWGYATILIKSDERDHDKWQTIFNDFRRRHLIPIVRIATQPEGAFWKRPYEKEEIAWADFLDRLIWPTKNRYITIYNEPNQGQEWGGAVDGADYALVLDRTITALKLKNSDFFVLNGGLDASAPSKLPLFEDELNFLRQMNESVPGIFNKLDGWVSHSYPNPGFVGSPYATGRGTTSTWKWELNTLRNLGLTKTLPVFITETGWKHAEGKNFDKSLPGSDLVANYYKISFENTWDDSQIVAITPFLLTYQDEPFDHFSFKRFSGEDQNLKILGVEYPDTHFYPQYQVLQNLKKVSGKPLQENRSELIKGEVFTSVVGGEHYFLPLTFKNTGQSVWGDSEVISLKATEGAELLGVGEVELPKNIKVEPGQDFTFILILNAPQKGNFKLGLNLFSGSKQFDQPPLETTIEVKQPVILKVMADLKWKKSAAGEFVLKVLTSLGSNIQKIVLNKDGESQQEEIKYLLPDYSFDFTLEKPYYKSKTIHQTVHSGLNVLDFGTLEPDFGSAVLNPGQLWSLLPWSQ